MVEKIQVVDYASKRKVFNKNILFSIGLAVFLFLLTFALYLNFTYLGARNKEVEDFIFSNFKLMLLWANLKILLVYIVIGVLLGIFTKLLKIESIRGVLGFNLFFWSIVWIRAIKLFPQMFTEQLFCKGFLLKYFQVFITDYLPLVLIYIIFIAVIAFIGIKKKRIAVAAIIVFLTSLLVIRVNESPIKNPAAKTGKKRPNILILATDSLRPQSISYNGYHRPTPNIDRLFSKGANFLNTKASTARTLQSWTSIMTSLYPPYHKLRHMFPSKAELQKVWPTMVDVFRKKNYHTAVVSDFAGDIFPSIDYGFQHVISPELRIEDALKQRSLEMHYFLIGYLLNPAGRLIFPEIWGMTLNKDPWYVTQYTKKSIKNAIHEEKPFFILYFTSNNHFPYVTKYPYYQLYTPKGYNGKHKYGLSSDVLETFLEAKLSAEELPHIINRYDSATKLFDDNVGELLHFLEECKIDDNTIIVIMSDHGESLYEKNYGLAHGDHLLGSYSNNMVFGVYSPFEEFHGRRVKQTVRDIDIAPTILDLINAPIPETFQGNSLLPVMRGAPFQGLPAYMETGIWYSTSTPFIDDKIRINYPNIPQLLKIEMPEGRIVLKEEYRDMVIKSKYRAFQLNDKKYIYMPGKSSYKEEYYINDKKVDPGSITDEAFRAFKEKMVEMFKDKFYIDEKGFIREYTNEEYTNEKQSDAAGTKAAAKSDPDSQ